ncbi:MAG: DUF4256 domain-containing protein [Candidatus Peregrinibacteria bacterium]|nr:DUF4256 domain-containing protein [Candidatus Peregrinibacteria bacterium]
MEHSRQEFTDDEAGKQEQLAFDAKNLIAIAEAQSAKLGKVIDPIDFSRREDDDISALRTAIAKEQGKVNPAVQDSGTPAPELSPEQLWLGQLEARFNLLPQLHKNIQWIDVEKSLKADPESMLKLQALDEKGHSMNVFGEENGEFIFASAWDNYEQVSKDHRNIVFDKKAEDNMCNGNATDIAKALGVDLADPKLHEQLIRAIKVNGWAWLKTDEATRKIGAAFHGDHDGVYRNLANYHVDNGSFRAALRVKKIA